MDESLGLRMIFFLSLAMTSLFMGASFMVVSSADSIAVSTSVTNTAPVVNSVFISSSGNGLTDAYPGGAINDLVAGGTRTIHVNGVVQDGNGQGDITSVSAKFYRSGVGSGCTQDSYSCYIVDSCSLDTVGVTNLQKRYNCTMNLSYYADSTSAGGEFPLQNWVAEISVKDTDLATGTDASLTKEMQTLLALNVPASIDYGSLELGTLTSSGNNRQMLITQAGNASADVEVSAISAMSCTIGSIPISNQKWATLDVPYSDVAARVLSNLATKTNLGVGYHRNAPSKTLHWNIYIPSTGVGGTCSGTMTVSTVLGT